MRSTKPRERLFFKRFIALIAVVASVLAGPSARAQDSLGLNTHVPARDLLDLCVDLGVGWIRVDANWLDMNPSSGTFAWTDMDRVVDDARARGLRVYMTLAYTPAWVPKVARARTDTYSGNDEPATSAEWTAFVSAAVTRYRARGVTHYGIWNEANLGGFWEEAAGIDAYIDKILVPGAATVRRVCSDCRVLGPDLAHVGAYDVALDRVLTRAASSIDILAHHIYSGWPETGTAIWDGDNFLQALEHRRFSFTRAALKEVLDARGFTREVWITETGLRARVGDAADETRQATYVRRVMEEQLARAWWTNTFFYEITDCGADQPTCDIDGFGITRGLRSIASGPRAWPADYRRKPAYDAIRAFITAHPEIVARVAPAACGNGRDDDGDGRIDAADRGCRDGTDTDESDDPPRRAIEAASTAGVTVDGDLSEWSDARWVTLGAGDWLGVVPYGGASDVGARVAARWRPDTLYLAVDVTDDRHVNDRSDDTLWIGDSLQLAFDVARNYGDRYDATDDHELNFALARGAPRAFRFVGPAGAATPGPVMIRRDATSTRYEIALPVTALAPATLREGAVFGVSLLVNDNDGASTSDGSGREGWIELTPGIGVRKEPYYFGELRLTGSAVALDAGAPVDAALPRDVVAVDVVARDAQVDARSSADVVADASPDAARRLDAAAADAVADASPDVSDAGGALYEEPPADCACDAPGARGGRGAARALVALGAICALAGSWRRAQRRARHPRG